MEPFEVVGFVIDVGFADEIFSFLFEDEFLDGLGDVARLKLCRIHGEAGRAVSLG